MHTHTYAQRDAHIYIYVYMHVYIMHGCVYTQGTLFLLIDFKSRMAGQVN